MQRYLIQLLEDLATMAANPPNAAWTKVLPHLALDPVIAELLLTWVKPHLEWAVINNAVKSGGVVRLEVAGTRPFIVRSTRQRQQISNADRPAGAVRLVKA
ncbi:MAG TPA: hypothetical protein ENN08_06455 [Bacteroidales bacterium]|nr:hypothetical protein [Bacteroidales bacterium]